MAVGSFVPWLSTESPRLNEPHYQLSLKSQQRVRDIFSQCRAHRLVRLVAGMSIDFPKEEERVLARWREIKAFETQVELSKGRKPYTFYDGPPFATGLPHYGHLLASTIKDIIPRYWSMKGRYVGTKIWLGHPRPPYRA